MNDHASTPSTRVGYALLAALALLLFLPGIGSFGFWDPYEIKIADAARNVAKSGLTFEQASQQLGRPAATVELVAAGFKAIGVGELGGRAPVAATSLLALLACFYAGTALVRRRGALVGSFMLALTPAFLLGARQLTTNAPLMLATALAVGGLTRFVAAGPRRFVHLGIGLVGLLLGQASAGVFVGVAAPLFAIAFAAPLRSRALAIGFGAVTALVVVAGVVALMHPGYSPLLGGAPHPFSPTGNTGVFTNSLKQLGFGFFPFIAVLPLATIHALSSTTSDDERAPGELFGGVTLIAWIVGLYAFATLEGAHVQEVLVPAGPPILLLVGAYLDDLFESTEAQPFAGLAVALAAIVLGRDFFVFPEVFVGAHMLETIRWPGPLTLLPYFMVGFAAFFGAAFGLLIGLPPKRTSRLVLAAGAVGGALVMALFIAHYVVPECSKHLSSKELYGRSKALDPNAPIGQYRFSASGSSYYLGGKTPVTLGSLDELFNFLGRGERVFVMAGAEELPSIDQFGKQKSATYFVIDDSSARYIMLSNRLGPGETDKNPLRLYLSDRAPAPGHPLSVDFDGKVELIGWDAPPQISNRQDLKLRLYFKTKAPLPGSYKIFVHVEGAGTRINGDHVPLDGKFPTQYWVPGTFITDEHVIHPADNNTGTAPPSGGYQIFVGMFQGRERLKILSGPSDGDNRARLGGININ